jgi:amino acid adenylation domain-containing protein
VNQEKINAAKQRLKARAEAQRSQARENIAGDSFALSSNQRRLWFLNQYENNPGTYLVPLCFRLQGKVDAHALEASLNSVIARHESLRTAFVDSETGPRQKILQDLNVSLIHERAVSSSPKLMEDALSFIEAQSRDGFDLSRPPLVRAVLVDLGPDDYLFGLILHHIVCDAWSLGVLFQELASFYAFHTDGVPTQLAQLDFQFKDYAEWERARYENGELESSRTFWTQKLAGHLPVLDLGQSRPPAVSFEGQIEFFSLNRERMQSVKDFADKNAVTPFVVLCAVYAALLGRYSRQDELVIGVPVANRLHRKADPLIGFFSNTVALHVEVDQGETFRSFLKRIHRGSLEALEHQAMPFDVLVNDLKVPRSLSHSPVFQTMFAMQNTINESGLNLKGLKTSPVEIHNGSSKVDLTFSAAVSEDGIDCSLEYASDIYDKDFIKSFLDAYEVLLGGMLGDPDRRLDSYPLLSQKQADELIGRISEGVARYARENFIHTLIEEQVSRTPHGIAVVSDHGRWTYETLNRDANRLAAHLRNEGLGPECIVALFLDRSYELVVTMLAVLKAGAAWVPLEVDFPEDRIKYILSDSGVRIVLTQSCHLSRVQGLGYSVLAVDGISKLFEGLPESNPGLALSPSHAAYIYYTSGSTGQPKGVVIDHECARNRLDWLLDEYPLTTHDRVLMKTPLIFDVIVWEVYLPLMRGAGIVITPAGAHADPAKISELMAAEDITLMHFVPSMLQAFLEYESGRQYPKLKWVVMSGEGCSVVTRDLFQREFTAELHNQYGQTETSEVGYWNCSRGQQPSYVPIGHQVGIYRLYVLDEYLRPLPVGMPGELYVAGDGGVARGYLGRPALTAERFVPNPFHSQGERLYRTGDLVKRLPDGSLKYLGRTDSQVKIRGCRVEIGEVEAVIGQHPAVQNCVVVARPNAFKNLQLIAYVIPRTGLALPKDLHAFMRARLASFMVPAAVVPIAEFPQTASGKIARNLLPDPDGHWFEAEGGIIQAPANELETQVLQVWSHVLERQSIGTNIGFFDMGGDSLKAIRLISKIHASLGIKLKVRDIFENPTIQAQASCIQKLGLHNSSKKADAIAATTATDRIPLSFAQKRLWFVEQMHPNLAQYNIGLSFHIKAPLSPVEMSRAFKILIERHEALRTVFHVEDGEPVQEILSDVPFSLNYLDLAHLSKGEQEERIQRVVDQDAKQAFSLEQAPLFRSSLVKLGDDEVFLTFVIHHIIADGWSLGLIAEDLTKILDDQEKGSSPRRPSRKVEYRDYAHWQSTSVQEKEHSRQLKYWFEKLNGDLPRLDLPTQRPRPSSLSFAGELLRFKLPKGLVEALRSVAAEEDATLFMVLLSLYKALLYRNSGQTDLIVGVPSAGRSHQDLEDIVGFFVNTLAIRTRLVPSESLRELIRKVKSNIIEAQDHQDLPFEVLVDNLKVPREVNQTPVFQTMFALQNTPKAKLGVKGQWATEVALDTATAKFDLTFSLTEEDDGIEALIEYSKDLFDASQVERLYRQFECLAQGFVNQPSAPVDSISILSEPEREWILETWNKSDFDFGSWRSMTEVFESQAAQTPDATALVFEGQSMSYAELNERSNKLARYLRSLGVQQGDYVALSLHRSFSMVIGIYAIQKAGASYVPMDPTIPRDRIQHMLQDSGSRLLITDNEALALLSGLDVTICNLDEQSARIESFSGNNLGIYGNPGDVGYLLYTSGSTGRPKGVAYTHVGSLNFLLWMQARFPLKSTDAVMQKTPFGFDVSIWELFWPLYVGARLVIIPSGAHADATYLGRVIEQQKITVMNFVPSMLAAFLNEESGYDCQSLRMVLAAGEALSVDLCQRFFQRHSAQLLNLYGPTEAGAVSYWVCDPKADSINVPIGCPCGNFQLYILDQNLRLVPAFVQGELYIASEYGLAQGYEGKPALTAEKFIPNPFAKTPGGRMYKTGDLCRYREDGAIEYLGRSDFQVKIRGVRIELEEIESVLRKHPAVRNCSVQAIKEGSEARLVAFIQNDEEHFHAASFRSYLSESLPIAMLPAQFIQVPEIPTTLNGKTDRAYLLAQLHDQSWEEPAAKAERLDDEFAARVQDIWSEILQCGPMGLNEDFFDIGGNSFRAIKLLAAFEKAFAVKLTVPFIFTHRTLGRQIEYLRSQAEELPNHCIVPLNPSKKPLLVLVHPVSGSVFPYMGLAQSLASRFSVYGLQAIGVEEDEKPLQSMDSMSKAYARAVHNVWSGGEIVLAGWSFGGIAALEVARELQDLGCVVRNVVMFDSWLPDAQSQLRKASSLEVNESLDLLVELEVVPIEQKELVRPLLKANIHALSSYKPRPYQGRVDLFQATEPLPLTEGDRNPANYDEPGLGWKRWIPNLKIHSCRGHHYSLLQSEYLSELSSNTLFLLERT